MNYILNLNLKRMCLAKIAIHLWTEDDEVLAIQPKTIKSLNQFSYEREVFEKIRGKVDHLDMHPSFKIQILSFIRPTGVQFCEWYRCLEQNFEVKGMNLKDVRWTPHGTVDQAKSVQLLLQRDESLSLKQRYHLACTFCLVEQVQELLKQMPDEEILPAVAYSNIVRGDEQDLVVYFTQCVKNWADWEINPLPYLSPYHEACHMAILSYNPPATQFFFQRLSSEEKDRILTLALEQHKLSYRVLFDRFHPEEFFTQLMCFFLSQMEEDRREEFLKANPGVVFQRLLLWPYHRHFLLETVRLTWDFLLGSDFNNILFFIFDRVNFKDSCCEYREVFELWRSSPLRLKTYVLDNLNIYRLSYYFDSGREELCKFLLSRVVASQNERLIFRQEWSQWVGSVYSCSEMVRQKRWNFLKFFIRECGTSRETIVRFKNIVTANNNLDLKNHETAEFLLFLENFYPDQKDESEQN